MRFALAVAALAAVVALSGCGGGGGTPGSGGRSYVTVIGTVVDDLGDGVGSATVTIANITGVTQSDGRFTILSVPTGSQTISASKDGFSTSKTVSVSGDPFDAGRLALPVDDGGGEEPPPPPFPS